MELIKVDALSHCTSSGSRSGRKERLSHADRCTSRCPSAEARLPEKRSTCAARFPARECECVYVCEWVMRFAPRKEPQRWGRSE